MSALSPHAGAMTGGARAHAEGTRLVVVWAVAGACGAGELRVEVHGGAATATLHLPGAGARVLAERAPATVTHDRALGFEHIDAPGVVRLTRAGERLLYAQTPALDRAGVAGGRAERPVMRPTA